MTLDDLADHVRKVSQEEGQKATIEVFNRRISEGRDEPTPRIIRRLIKRVDPSLTLHDLYDMAGHSETTQHWSNERYELWGEEYLWANKGRFPSANALNEFAKKRKGPSQNGVRNRYQTINSYHDSLEARFSTHFDQYMDEVATGIIENRLPIDLIANTKSEWVVAKRYIKYS
jgi:hypothetical protein